MVNLSYYNWAEVMEIQSAASKLESRANFGGLGVEFEFTRSKKNSGWNFAAAYISGQATGGTKAGALVYFASYQKFNAFTFKATRFTRLYPRVYLEIGPLLMYRPFVWPTDAGLAATSGSSFNYGLTLDLRLRLAPRVDFCQSIGTLLTKASTIWSLGFGYRF